MSEPEKPKLFSPGVGKRDMTQLHYDACCGNLEGPVRCLENRLDVHAADTYRGYSPLHWLADMAACGGPRVEMLRELARRCADINARSWDGSTPLTLAREANSPGGDELAAELLALGAVER